MDTDIIGAFSEEQVERLTGLSRSQLRRWNTTGFIRPELVNVEGRRPFSRIYSFKDLLKLRVLNQLRNVHNVPMSELRHVARELSHMGDGEWTSQKLWVHRRKVVFVEPESSRKREISSKQFIAEIPLEVVTSEARDDIRRMNKRAPEEIGKLESRRYLHSSDKVFAGTRIPVSAVISFMRVGRDDDDILRQYPDLEPGDLEEARRHLSDRKVA